MLKNMIMYYTKYILYRKEFTLSFLIMLIIALGDFIIRCVEFWGEPYSRLIAGSQLFVGAAYSTGGSFLLIFLPFIAAIPFSDVYLTEKKYSVINTTITRFGSRSKYYLTSALAVFISSFIITLIPLALNAVLVNITFPETNIRDWTNLPSGNQAVYMESMQANIPFSALFIESPRLYPYVTSVALSLFAGAAGVFAYAFSYLISKRRIFVYMSFFTINLCMTFASDYLTRFYGINISVLSYLFFCDSSPKKSLAAFIVTTAVLAGLIILLAGYGLKRLRNII